MLFKDAKNGFQLDVFSADHMGEYNEQWGQFSLGEQQAIYYENDKRVANETVTNTTQQGAKYNPLTGLRGDWSGTAYDPIYRRTGSNHDLARLFFGLVWKKYFIDRPDCWVGYRTDGVHTCTFPNKRQNLEGKTYFRPDNQQYLLALVQGRRRSAA